MITPSYRALPLFKVAGTTDESLGKYGYVPLRAELQFDSSEQGSNRIAYSASVQFRRATVADAQMLENVANWQDWLGLSSDHIGRDYYVSTETFPVRFWRGPDAPLETEQGTAYVSPNLLGVLVHVPTFSGGGLAVRTADRITSLMGPIQLRLQLGNPAAAWQEDGYLDVVSLH
jgi:hypothetical protein